jgi:oxygen-dependent protoporphyrinogen oxidase
VLLAGREVVVIGAGPAGLAAALALQGRGVKVSIVEKANEAGGRSGFDRVGDWRFDRGAEFLTSFYKQTLQLCSQVDWTAFEGLSLEMGRLILDGHPFTLPATPWKLLRTKLISARTKRRLFGFGWELARWGGKVRWGELEKAAPLDDQSAEDYFREVLGQDYVDTVLRATLESLTLSPLSDTSRVIGLSQAREATGAKLLCPRGGLGALWLEVAKRVPLTTARAVTSVAATGAQGSKVSVAFADGTSLQADAVVVAVPAPEAVRLVPRGLIPERDTAERARYSPCVKLHLCLEKPLPGLVPCCAIGPGTNPLGGLGVLEQKGTGQAPAGKSGLVLVASPALAFELLSASDEEVERRLVPAAEALAGVRITGVVGRSVVRLPEGVPLFYVGWLRELAELKAKLAPSRVALAGDYLASPSIEGAVRTGQEAAERVCDWLARQR